MTSQMTLENGANVLSRGDVRVGPWEPEGRPRRRGPAALRVVLAVPMMFAASFSPALMAVMPGLQGWLDTKPLIVGVAATYVMYAIPVVVAVVGIVLAMRFIDRRPVREAGLTWNRRSFGLLLLGAASTIVVGVLVGLAAQASGTLRATDLAATTGGAPMWAVVAVWVARAFLLQGIPEELVWRGYVMQTLRTSPAVTAFISSAVFAVCHLVSGGGQESLLERFLYLVMPFGFALFAAALVIRTGSVWSAVGVHGGFHLSLMIGMLFLGVGNGPTLWLSLGAVLALLGVAVLATPRQTTRGMVAHRAGTHGRAQAS